jgi:hypothetical protein
MEEIKEPWEPSWGLIDKENCSKENLLVAFEQANKTFEHTHKTADIVDGKIQSVMGAVSTVLAALLATLLAATSLSTCPQVVLVVIGCGCLFYTAMLISLARLLAIQNYYPVGGEPKHLLEHDFYYTSKPETFLAAQLKTIQYQLDFNKVLNDKKASGLSTTLAWLTRSPIFLGLLWAALQWGAFSGLQTCLSLCLAYFFPAGH